MVRSMRHESVWTTSHSQLPSAQNWMPGRRDWPKPRSSIPRSRRPTRSRAPPSSSFATRTTFSSNCSSIHRAGRRAGAGHSRSSDLPGRYRAAAVPASRGRSECRLAYSIANTVPQLCPEDRHLLQSEMAARVIQVVHFGLDSHLVGSHAVGRSPTAALVVVDELESLSKTGEFGQQVLVVEIGTAVQQDDRRPWPTSRTCRRALPGIRQPGTGSHRSESTVQRRPTADRASRARRGRTR